jgi:hypothetical protein
MGVVTASGSNEKLSGVEIKFEGTRGGRLVLIGSATSREDGSYYLRDEGFLGFGGDTIRVTASLSGYKTWSGDVTLDGTVTLNIELTPASNDRSARISNLAASLIPIEAFNAKLKMTRLREPAATFSPAPLHVRLDEHV